MEEAIDKVQHINRVSIRTPSPLIQGDPIQLGPIPQRHERTISHDSRPNGSQGHKLTAITMWQPSSTLSAVVLWRGR